LVEFVVAHVCESIDSLGVSLFGRVVLEDVLVGVCEKGESVFVFLFGSIGSVELGDEVDEFSLGISDGG